jgi:hypothetical protein
LSVQEFTQRGPADWGQKFSFEIGSLPAGDLLQAVILQIKLGSWYNGDIIKKLANGDITTNTTSIYIGSYNNTFNPVSNIPPLVSLELFMSSSKFGFNRRSYNGTTPVLMQNITENISLSTSI